MRATSRSTRGAAARTLALLVALLAGACADDGSDGDDGAPGDPAPTDRDLGRGEAAPGVVLTILGVGGASGADGSFRVGDQVAVTYRLTKLDGSRWGLGEMDFGRVHLAGPTFDYQRVLPEVADLAARSERNPNGSYTYRFADPLPAHYRPPYHDSPAFGPGDGELAGEPLFAGTYTVGLSFGWRYRVDGREYVDLGEASRDVLFGGASTLLPRRVTQQANCDRCHVQLRYHGGERGELVQCLMCHTDGAEDVNDPALGGGTPGVSIASRVLFHRVHAAAHLPSVVGVGVDAAGDQDYGVAPRPLVLASGTGELVDFSFVDFPAFPNKAVPREKNFGWSGLPDAARAREDAVRTGIVACAACHGDPDGDGPLEPPAQGDTILAQPTRRACGACHDDVDWTQDYRTNLQSMPAQPDDSQCVFCHDASGGPLGVVGGHAHPLDDPVLNPGLVARLEAVLEAAPADGDGTLEPGEGLALRLALEDELGTPVDPALLDAVEVLLAGPSENAQLVQRAELPAALLAGAPPWTVPLPERVELELLGRSTAALGDVFATARRPHLHVAGALTAVHARTASGALTALAAPAGPTDNFLDVLDPAGFADGDVVVLEDGAAGREELVRVSLVDGARLWLSSPAGDGPHAPRLSHAAGASVTAVTLSGLAEGVDYALDPATGGVTELVEQGDGTALVASYSTPFVVPAAYPLPLHGSPDVGEREGEWSGDPLVAGTYALTLTARDSLTTFFAGETNVYPVAARAQRLELQIGAAPVRPWAGIDLPAACDACHRDLQYHGSGAGERSGGRYRGFEACLACHGTAGAEDRPRYVAPGAPETAGTEVGFRRLLHRLHRGMDLEDPAGHPVVGEGPPPEGFLVRGWEDVRFPALPGRTQRCARCHGPANDAWREPAPRDHPTDQDEPAAPWRVVCLACHDGAAAEAHADANTAPSGIESCGVCHGEGEELSVEAVHLAR